MTGCCSASGHSSSAQDESERSPSAYAPRRSWHFIRRWCVARTADCSRRASARSSPDRRGRARHSSRPSSSSSHVILGSAVHGLRASSRERSGPTSIRTPCIACCRHTLAPSRAEPGPRGCRSSATRQTACGAWISFDASPSCSGATGRSWSWTNARVASSWRCCTNRHGPARCPPTGEFIRRLVIGYPQPGRPGRQGPASAPEADRPRPAGRLTWACAGCSWPCCARRHKNRWSAGIGGSGKWRGPPTTGKARGTVDYRPCIGPLSASDPATSRRPRAGDTGRSSPACSHRFGNQWAALLAEWSSCNNADRGRRRDTAAVLFGGTTTCAPHAPAAS